MIKTSIDTYTTDCDQPVTCPDCGSRTDFEEIESPIYMQFHTCLNCRQDFNVIFEEEKEDSRLWNDNSIQFPRLISEIFASVALSDQDVKQLKDSMDISHSELFELFERAQSEFDNIKYKLGTHE